MAPMDLTGQALGRWLVLSESPRHGAARRWLCVCECGVFRVVCHQNVAYGASKSCGCLSRQVAHDRLLSHGRSRDSVFRRWASMINRCTNPNDKDFASYGGRGITVCDRWRTFANFLADMGDPLPYTQLEREDNDMGYEPGNCVWATRAAQVRNRRSTRWITHGGKTMTLLEWARECGMPGGTLRARMSRGWAVARALTEPMRGTNG